MSSNVTPVTVVRDDSGSVIGLGHLSRPFTSAAPLGTTHPRALSDDYLGNVPQIYQIPNAYLDDLHAPIASDPTSDGVSLRFVEQKSRHNGTIVSYAQTVLGLPIWECGFSVSVLPSPLRVSGSVSSVKLDVEVSKPKMVGGPTLAAEIVPETLHQLLSLEPADGQSPATVNSTRLLVYQYDPAARQEGDVVGGMPSSGQGLLFGSGATLRVPPVSDRIEAGRYYVVREILFSYPVPELGPINWRAFVEPETSSVLYLRSFLSAAQGYVLRHDPITTSGSGPSPAASDALLNPLRETVTILGLTPQNPQSLTGDFTKVSELSPPAILGPVEASKNFFYDVHADGFAATSAYYHVETLFRMLTDLGFDVPQLFVHTAANPGLPLPVDQSSVGGMVNAFGIGNSTGTGGGGILFGHLAAGTDVSIAVDFRVVCHEFCHEILWECVSSPNFGFSHSAGDSIAAILSDPVSKAPDRFQTFPWVPVVSDRRHDRGVAAGWAFGGIHDDHGYGAEQCLSTTLFRAYRSIGGDATANNLPTWSETRTWASKYLLYLIVGGIASLATTPITPTPKAEIYASAMMLSDAAVLGFDKQPGGTIRKVIRWSFEKQGAYQPAGAPTPVISPGPPPDIDVYIDDGRQGEYQYLHAFWETTDIWNRHCPDGGSTHESPFVHVPNYAYVRVKNRGTKTATNVVVSGYHVRPSAGLVWPDMYQPMTTASIAVPGGLPSGGQVVVGPFVWTPTELGHECMLMSISCAGDRSNIDPATGLPCAQGPIPDYRLVPFDNNIAQRNVVPVPGGCGGRSFKKSLEGKQFWANNPYDRVARLHIEIQVPPFLEIRGWKFSVRSEESGAVFTLAPRAFRRFTIHVQEGQDFGPEAVDPNASKIRVLNVIDGITVGGMSYSVDPALKEPPPECKAPPCRDGQVVEEAETLLKCLGLGIPADRIAGIEATKITIEIDLKKRCC